MSRDLWSGDSTLDAVGEAFGLGEFTSSPRLLADGLMNLNWRVDTDAGSFAVKEVIDVPVRVARRNLRIVSALAGAGEPACTPRLTHDGDVVAEVAARGYCVMDWVAGDHRPGPDLSLDEAGHLGEVLAKLHTALSRYAPGRPECAPTQPNADPDAAAAVAGRFLARIEALDSWSAFDRAAAEALRRRKQMLAANGHEQPGANDPVGPSGWTHGDFQHRNLIWSDDRVAAVLDWDRLAVRPYAEELARTAQSQFGTSGQFDLERVNAFTAAYRRVIPLTDADLSAALNRLWWRRITDFWQLDFHYGRGNHDLDASFVEDEKRLRWWTDHAAVVRAAVTG